MAISRTTMQRPPDLRHERLAWARGCEHVAGADEAGRGAWAGPLVAAAVCLPACPRKRARLTRYLRMAGTRLDDSKRLSSSQRSLASRLIVEHATSVSIVVMEVADIDRHGVGWANLEGLRRAAFGLKFMPEFVLLDAFAVPELAIDQLALVHGDQISQSVAAASIVAKHARDELLLELHADLPEYGFDRHKGYGTRSHAEALLRCGVSRAHRRSFAPIAQLLANQS